MRRRFNKSDVKYVSLTNRVHWKLLGLNMGEAIGIPGVGVESVDIRKNIRGEGGLLA